MRSSKVFTIVPLLLVLIAAAIPATAELTPLEQLGKLLFFDTRLSTPPGQSCATCHDPAVGFTGPVSELNAHGAVYPGAVHTRFGNRKPPASAYVVFSPDFYYDPVEEMYVGGMFWDGRAANVVEQAKGPFLNMLEQNNPNKRHVVTRVKHGDYADLFREVWGAEAFNDIEMAYEQIAQAIGAYEGSEEVDQFSSKYDYYLAGMVELTEQEMRGLQLYEGPAMCSACHPSQASEDGTPPLFTDYTYDNLGVPKNLENPFYDMPPGFNPLKDGWIDYGLGAVVGDPAQNGKMKVPTLRNVAKDPYPGFVHAFMHNGAFKSLHEVVDFYNTRDLGGWPPPEVPENVNTDELGNLGLSDQDVDDIVAFLLTLSDGYVPEGKAQAARVALASGSSFPNPFRGSTEIRFALPQPGAVTLCIYDVSGREVRRLLDEVALSGAGAAIWDGTDASGRDLPAGVYYYRVSSGARQEAHRLVLVR